MSDETRDGCATSMRARLACTERFGKNWVRRVPSQEVQHAASEFMLRGLDIDQLPLGVIEALVEWKLIADDLDTEHRHIFAGGGIEASDHVRELLRVEQRMARIAEAHQKAVDEHGGTWGDCAECGHAWPCPTYRWATEDVEVPSCASWTLDDDDPFVAAPLSAGSEER